MVELLAVAFWVPVLVLLCVGEEEDSWLKVVVPVLLGVVVNVELPLDDGIALGLWETV